MPPAYSWVQLPLQEVPLLVLPLVQGQLTPAAKFGGLGHDSSVQVPCTRCLPLVWHVAVMAPEAA